MLLKKLEKKYPKPFKALRIGEKMLDVLDRVLLIISILGFLGIGTYTVKENMQQDESYSKVQTSNEFDINDLKIEFTNNGRAIITNNSPYTITETSFSFKEDNTYMIGTDSSLRPGESQNIDAQKYYKKGGYTISETLISYIDNDGNHKDVIYDNIANIYE